MHHVDRLELLQTAAQLTREAGLLVADPGAPDRLMRLRRIVFLLGYMSEHLEMLAKPLHGPGLTRAEPVEADSA
jgi:hypothetical protein